MGQLLSGAGTIFETTSSCQKYLKYVWWQADYLLKRHIKLRVWHQNERCLP